MQENKLLGALLPSHPDLLPIIKAVRAKYNLPELYPDDIPIKEIFLGDEFISFEEFRQDIKKRILENMTGIFPEDFIKQYQTAKKAIEADYQTELSKFSEELKPGMEVFFEYVRSSSQVVYQILDAQVDSIVNMLYINILLGEDTEAPQEWFGKVATMKTGDETIVFAMASELTDLDLLFQQIRELHKKTFGIRRKKITKSAITSAYYLRLTKTEKDKDFIFDEYIRRNKFKLPDKNSTRYIQVKNMYAQRLKKKLQRTKIILDVIVRDKK